MLVAFGWLVFGWLVGWFGWLICWLVGFWLAVGWLVCCWLNAEVGCLSAAQWCHHLLFLAPPLLHLQHRLLTIAILCYSPLFLTISYYFFLKCITVPFCFFKRTSITFQAFWQKSIFWWFQLLARYLLSVDNCHKEIQEQQTNVSDPTWISWLQVPTLWSPHPNLNLNHVTFLTTSHSLGPSINAFDLLHRQLCTQGRGDQAFSVCYLPEKYSQCSDVCLHVLFVLIIQGVSFDWSSPKKF